MYMFIYIYIYRERERELERHLAPRDHVGPRAVRIPSFLPSFLPSFKQTNNQTNNQPTNQPTNQTNKQNTYLNNHAVSLRRWHHVPILDRLLVVVVVPVLGRHYLSNATRLIRPHLFYALFGVSRINTICCFSECQGSTPFAALFTISEENMC